MISVVLVASLVIYDTSSLVASLDIYDISSLVASLNIYDINSLVAKQQKIFSKLKNTF